MNNSVHLTELEARLIMRQYFVMEVAFGQIAQIYEESSMGRRNPLAGEAMKAFVQVYDSVARPILKEFPQYDPTLNPLSPKTESDPPG